MWTSHKCRLCFAHFVTGFLSISATFCMKTVFSDINLIMSVSKSLWTLMKSDYKRKNIEELSGNVYCWAEYFSSDDLQSPHPLVIKKPDQKRVFSIQMKNLWKVKLIPITWFLHLDPIGPNHNAPNLEVCQSQQLHCKDQFDDHQDN